MLNFQIKSYCRTRWDYEKGRECKDIHKQNEGANERQMEYNVESEWSTILVHKTEEQSIL